jgi:hypothetical protein
MGIVRMKRSFFQARPRTQHDVWAEFFADAELLARNHVTQEESEILHDFSPLGAVTCIGDILFILSTIRWANRPKLS